MSDAALLDMFYRTAELQSGRLFLVGQRQLTYGAAAREVRDRAAQLTAATDSLPVVLRGSNLVEWVLVLLAARTAGLPILLLPSEATADQCQQLSELIGPTYHYNADLDQGAIVTAQRPHRRLPAHVALGLPTSGSTGTPRYALRSERSLLAEGERYVQNLGLTPTDRILVALPLGHAFTLGLALGSAIAVGCTLHLLPRFMPRAIQQALCEGQASVLPLVPAAARVVGMTFQADRPVPHGLRQVVVGAGIVTPELERTLVERLGCMPTRNYGCSETGATLGSDGQPVPEGVSGRPLPGVEVAVAADETACGALFVRTSVPFIGYLTHDGIDASRISPDGWYSTGDLARRDADGWISIVGRLGLGLRRGGRFIQPAEVQRVLLRHPDVVDALVVGELDEHGEDLVTAHVETRPGARLDNQTLHEHVARALEGYKIPSIWHVYDVLPRTSSGKPDRARINGSIRPPKSEPTVLLTALMAHRLSTTVIIAQELGLLAKVAGGPLTAADLAVALNLDQASVQALLMVLAAAGLLTREHDGAFRALVPLAGPGISALIELETELRRSWLSEAAVVAAVRGGVNQRAFEAEMSEQFSTLYNKVMGTSSRVQALQAWRRLAVPAGRVLDLGRPPGAWAELARQRAPEQPATVLDVPPGHQPFIGDLPDAPLGSIFMHNCVRRLAEPDTPLSLAGALTALQPGGLLIVSDIFLDAPGPQPWLRPALLLDWLTHGNLAWQYGVDLCVMLKELGYVKVHRSQSDHLFELITAWRPDM